MSETLKRAIELWRVADSEARSAEHMLTQAYDEIFSKRGTSVAPELIDQVARMRTRSNELLMDALNMLKTQRTVAMTPKPRPRQQ